MPSGQNKHFSFKKMCSIRQFFRAVFLVVGLICLTLGLSQLTFAEPYTSVIKSVEINSQHANYANGDPGAWKVEKSAQWIDEGKARITFKIDTILKTVDASYTDIIMVIDNSGSMDGEKMSQVKSDSTALINSVLSNTNNRIALVNFNSTATKLSGFTNNKTNLLNLINNLDTPGNTNYYDGFKKAEEILEGYQKQSNRELIMLFLTDGYPNEDSPNEIAEYHSLKQMYPYMTINGIQYEMGDEILQPIKDISDNQYIANMDSLNNVLFEASVAPYAYENFTITDYIDDTYWNVSSVDDLEASIGEATLTYDGSTPKVTWVMNEAPKTGRGATLTIDITLKNNLNLTANSFLPTNKSESISTTLPETSNESITSTLTPVLKAKYNVSYEANPPSSCSSVSGSIPSTQSYSPFSIVQISGNTLACEGYNFNGWEIAEGDPKIINDDYFKIINDDVVLRATWSKPSITKSMDGTVNEEVVATLAEGPTINALLKQVSGQAGATGATANTTITAIKSADSMSLSQQANSVTISASDSNVPIYAWFDDIDGTIYIYSDADKIMCGPLSLSGIFARFTALEDLSGASTWDTSKATILELAFLGTAISDLSPISTWDVSNVIDMTQTFYEMPNLTNIDALANWDTSKVTKMDYLFRDSNALTNIDGASNWDTSKVTSMGYMFTGSTSLTNIDGAIHWDTSSVTDMDSIFASTKISNIDALSGWNTSKVRDMGSMFSNTPYLINIDGASNWNTSSVTSMRYMFSSASSLTNIDGASYWNTSKVTNMYSMFDKASKLTNIDGASNWNTSSVTDMRYMFSSASSLTNIDGASGWDTSSVTNMRYMFQNTSSLTNIDGASGWDTSSVTDMSYMFSDATSLANINGASNWDTSNVTNMSNMFNCYYYNSSSLTDINGASNWDTSSVTKMDSMFYHAKMSNIDALANWDTSSVNDMSQMFRGTPNLVNIDGVSNWDTSSVTNMGSMFSDASSLANIDGVSGWDTSSVKAMSQMFRETDITNIDALANWDMSNVTNISSMFYQTNTLSNIDGVSGWNTSNVNDMSSMFWETSIVNVNALTNWNTTSVTNMKSMFYQINSLNNIDGLRNWDTHNVTTIESMFASDQNITNLSPLENWDTANITNMTRAFYNIPSSVARPSWYSGS